MGITSQDIPSFCCISPFFFMFKCLTVIVFGGNLLDTGSGVLETPGVLEPPGDEYCCTTGFVGRTDGVLEET